MYWILIALNENGGMEKKGPRERRARAATRGAMEITNLPYSRHVWRFFFFCFLFDASALLGIIVDQRLHSWTQTKSM